MDYIKIILSIFAAIYASQSKAGELGNFRLTNYLIETEMVAGQDSVKASGFHLGKSYFSLQWDKEKKLGGYIQVSGKDLSKTPLWYSTSYSHDSIFSLVYAYYKISEETQISMGLQEVPYGLESYLGIDQRELPDSLLLSKRYIVYSDIGLSFKSVSKGLETNMLIHNGYGVSRESVKQNDDRVFYSARISKESDSGEIVGLSAQFGQYQEDGQSLNHKLAMYNVFALYRLFDGYLSLDLNSGTTKSDLSELKFGSYYLEYRYPFTRSFSMALRTNELEPNTKQDNDKINSNLIAFLWNDRNANSRLALVFSENKQEQGQTDSIVLLNWKLSSNYNKRY